MPVYMNGVKLYTLAEVREELERGTRMRRRLREAFRRKYRLRAGCGESLVFFTQAQLDEALARVKERARIFEE